jgi:hypothetical protein
MRDIEYVAQHQAILNQEFASEKYTETSQRRHKKIVLEFYGFQQFDSEAKQSVNLEITSMVKSQLKPKLIFFRCLDHIISQHIQVPNYHRQRHKIWQSELGTVLQAPIHGRLFNQQGSLEA